MASIMCCKGERSQSEKAARKGEKAESDCDAWLRKCSARQSANTSAEALAVAKAKSERAQRMSKMSRKAGKLQKSNVMCQRAWNSEMSFQGSAEVRSLDSRSRSALMKESSDRASMRMETVQRAAAESESDEDELDVMGAEMGIVACAAPVEVEEKAGQMEMAELLEQLKKEPAEEQEQQAKFILFEKYLETVEKMRNETFEFWSEARMDFHEAGRGDIDRCLKRIDGADNMSVDFSERRWFVYDMTAKAGKNCAIIGGNLAMIKSRIELLARQDDCPVCLDPLEECGQEVHVLQCCHKVCGECWAHWSDLHHGRAFCPLCRNEEFLGDMMRRADALEH